MTVFVKHIAEYYISVQASKIPEELIPKVFLKWVNLFWSVLLPAVEAEVVFEIQS